MDLYHDGFDASPANAQLRANSKRLRDLTEPLLVNVPKDTTLYGIYKGCT